MVWFDIGLAGLRPSYLHIVLITLHYTTPQMMCYNIMTTVFIQSVENGMKPKQINEYINHR